MQYRGPEHTDFANVRALNGAFIEMLCGAPRGKRFLRYLPPDLQERCRKLNSLRRQRLAATPFLLFSFHETDAEAWDSLLHAHRHRDLFSAIRSDPLEAAIVAAGIGFAWQLARQNSYVARLVCGASLHWCEQIAARPLLDLVRAATAEDVLSLRSESDAFLWHKLIDRVTSGEKAVASAARFSALQRVLTTPRPGSRQPPAVAARRIVQPMQVAEHHEPE